LVEAILERSGASRPAPAVREMAGELVSRPREAAAVFTPYSQEQTDRIVHADGQDQLAADRILHARTNAGCLGDPPEV
jgi:hypothetical protein